MLLPKEVITKYGKPKGIIHVGAHEGEEAVDYRVKGIDNVIWIEANEDLIPKIKANPHVREQPVICAAVSNKDGEEVTFKITNNFQSSSILNLKEHLRHYPNITVTEERTVKTKTLDTIIEENNIDMSKYDFMNIDIQGADYLALKGMQKNLKYIRFIYIEVNFQEMYEGCGLFDDVKKLLEPQGFVLKEIVDTGVGWGDAVWVRE